MKAGDVLHIASLLHKLKSYKEQAVEMDKWAGTMYVVGDINNYFANKHTIPTILLDIFVVRETLRRMILDIKLDLAALRVTEYDIT